MIDIDVLFENFMRKYLAENAGKFTEDELEDKVSELYAKFGDAPIKELGEISPRAYFAAMSDEQLVDALKNCVSQGIAVSDFLCEEAEKRINLDQLLIDAISPLNDELSVYCVNILNAKGAEKAFEKYLSVLIDERVGDSLAELITETLSDDADKVKESILEVYDKSGEAKKYLVEILSRMSRDDRVFDILSREFIGHKEATGLYAAYLTRYGDDRALPLFLDRIKDSSIPYVDFKELKMGIENFGGECEAERDFSSDDFYKKYNSGN